MPVNSFDDYPMTWRPVLKKDGTLPLYREIAKLLEQAIRDGSLQPGDKLPPQRELADFLDVNLATVARAFQLCKSRGLIGGEIGRGTYVRSTAGLFSPMLEEEGPDHVINLGASHPIAPSGPWLTGILNRLLKRTHPENLFTYAEPDGRIKHRRSGASWLARRGLAVSEENILITSGLQNSLAVILTSLFRCGDKIATDALIYPGFKNLAAALGIVLLPVPDKEGAGMDPEALARICRTEKPRGLYVMPDHHNPTARYTSETARDRLAAVCRQYRLTVIEDAAYSFLSEKKRRPLAARIPEQCLYLCPLSNSLAAGLRIAFLAAPSGWLEPLKEGNSHINVMAAPLEAEIACQLIESGLAEQMILAKRQELFFRNRLTDQYLTGRTVWGNAFSQFRWLLLPTGWSGKRFEEEARCLGVRVFGCDRFLVGNTEVPAAARLAISSPKDREELEQGLALLQKLLARP